MKRGLHPDPALPGITVAGLAATIAQVLLLRELLVLFYGNEMSAALALAGWLLWTALGSALAARRARRGVPRASTLALLLALLAVALPALVLTVRAARGALAIGAGELAPLGKMVLVCLGVPSLFGLVAGAPPHAVGWLGAPGSRWQAGPPDHWRPSGAT